MGNKRLTIQRVDQFIRLLGATSVKIKGETDGPKDLEHDSRASSGIRSTCQQEG